MRFKVRGFDGTYPVESEKRGNDTFPIEIPLLSQIRTP